MKTMVLDIGGTAIKSAVAENGVLSDIRETPTQASLGGEHVMALAKEIIASYKEHWDFARIGISTAGQVNPEKGQHHIRQPQHSRLYGNSHQSHHGRGIPCSCLCGK